jgi:hypothetical protein
MKTIIPKFEVRIDFRDGVQRFRYFSDIDSADRCHNYYNNNLGVRRVSTQRMNKK